MTSGSEYKGSGARSKMFLIEGIAIVITNTTIAIIILQFNFLFEKIL